MKFAILRALLAGDGRRLGVFWWLCPDETHNKDGKHRRYLERPEHWRPFDCELFDALRRIDLEGRRDVRALEGAMLLPGAQYFSQPVPSPDNSQPQLRRAWIGAGAAALDSCDLLFLDPDNGIASAKTGPSSQRARKSVLLEELHSLRRPGRALIVYHHQSRFPGGHELEFEFLSHRLEQAGLRVCGALRAKPFSPRLFFIIDGADDLCTRAKKIAQRWAGEIRWLERISDLARP